MSFLKNVLNVLTDKRELKEPKIYKPFNENSSIITALTRLSEGKDPSVDLKKAQNHLKLFTIGQTGEMNVLFELQHSMLPLVILHDVYIEYKDYSAQLDFVVLTHKFIMIIEVKKLFGNIQVTDKGEFQRIITKNNRVVNKEGMYSPINQVERHVSIIEKLLKEEGAIENCPVKYAVTFANPKTILQVSKNAPANIQSNVLRYDQIKHFIKNELEKKSPVFMSDQQLYGIADTILKFSKEKVFNQEDYLIEKPQISPQVESATSPSERMNNPKEDTLKAALTEFRLTRSRESNVKPYHIFTNKILDSMLEKKPLTTEQLLEIEGIGPKRVEEFGKEIVSIIQCHSTGNFSAKEPPTSVKAAVQPKKQSPEQVRSALTQLRTTRSKELNVKPYYVFTNNTLEMILEKKPVTMDELLKIDGIGPKKAEEFGQDIINILQRK
ncbi:helicase [Rossellomorea vietnamensis]|uniref:Helicase n=1 Tax=Rossellomorea vietnamensis TaxID=218284 RepID=A0A5D4K9R0_9BACI|nr:HRDC domain-containing protein [Rossellomorea vietnamensis]TYR73450.1 helicase [Rossellomorea vietnamensis]